MMASFHHTFNDLTKQNHHRSLIIKGIYDKVISAIEITKNEYLILTITDYLNDYPLWEIENRFQQWFTYPKELIHHNYDIHYDISVILGFLMPYYVDFINTANDDITPMKCERHRIIKPLTAQTMPPAYTIHHVHCMLDILMIECIKKSKPSSKGGTKANKQHERARSLFEHHYMVCKAQNPAMPVKALTDMVTDLLLEKYQLDINYDTADSYRKRLRNSERLSNYQPIQILGKPHIKLQPYKIYIRKDLKKYIKNMGNIYI